MVELQVGIRAASILTNCIIDMLMANFEILALQTYADSACILELNI